MCIRDRPTPHRHPFQRMCVRSSISFYGNFNLDMDRSPGFGSACADCFALFRLLFLRVVPKSLNEESIHFLNDSLTTFDAAMAERISHNFFKCRNQIDIENTNPTARSADDLRGSEVMVGEYLSLIHI